MSSNWNCLTSVGLSWAALVLFCSYCLGLALLAAASTHRCQLQHEVAQLDVQVQPSDEARDRLAMYQVHDSVEEVRVPVHLHEKHLRSLQIEEGPRGSAGCILLWSRPVVDLIHRYVLLSIFRMSFLCIL